MADERQIDAREQLPNSRCAKHEEQRRWESNTLRKCCARALANAD
jgi:hypothetical protein